MMPSLARVTLFALLIGLLPSAAGQDKVPESPYYPLTVGSRWHYKSGDQKVVVHVTKHGVIERNEGKERVPVAILEVTSGDRVLTESVTISPDGVFRISGAGKEIVPPLCFLKLPPKAGEKWTVKCDSDGTALSGIFTSGEAKVSVPAQNDLPAITVSCSDFQMGSQKMAVEYWFVPNVGMVKQRVQVGTFEVFLELERYEPGKGN